MPGGRSTWRDLLVLVRLLPQISRMRTATGLALIAVDALLALLFAVTTGRAIGNLIDVVGRTADSPEMDAFRTSIIHLVVLFVLQQAVEQLMAINQAVFVRQVNGRLRERAMSAVLAPATIDQLQRADVRAAVDRARELAPAGFTPGEAASAILNQVREQATGLVAAGALLQLGQWEVVVMLLLARTAAQYEGITLFWKNLRLVVGGDVLRRASYFRDLGLGADAAKEVRIFGLSGWLAERNRAATMSVLEEAWRTRHNRFSILCLAFASATLALVPAGVLGARTLDGTLTPAVFATALVLARQVGAWGLGNDQLAIGYGAAAVPAIVEVEALMTDVAAPAERFPVGLPRHDITIEGLHYTYPGSSDPVFHDFSLHIPAGQRLAVVGLNGAGKTTLVKLLCGLLTPDAGRILVDGTDLATVDPASWRASIATLFQDFVRYQLSARDNVAYGAIDLPIADDDLERLSDDVGLDPLIEDLPRGWDTTLSPQFVGGSDLSGGQWQRIAFARALRAVDAGARLLILDEPTAALDVRAEAALYERFLELTDRQGLTTILISHRFSTVRQTDRIVVVEHGRIIEDGSHADLVAAGGRYAGLFSIQARRFQDADEADDAEVAGTVSQGADA